MPKLSIYLSSRIRQHTLDKNKAIGELLERDGDIKIFLPHTISPSEHHEKIQEDIYRKCVDEISKAEVLLLLADSYGIDCSWEVGYAKGIQKLIIAVIETEGGLKRLREDWMVKGSVDAVIITNNELYKTASKDAMLQNKKLLMVKYQELPKTFRSLARGGSNGSK
ncbi:hypothetical protein D4Q76_02300 [archaeon]|nr:MAG: hypothetical protein D4Q76_02300 [archaeon]